MITYNNIAELEQAQLLVDDIVQVLGEVAAGDRGFMMGIVRGARPTSGNRVVDIKAGKFVEIMPDLVIQSGDVSESEATASGTLVRRKIKEHLSDTVSLLDFKVPSDKDWTQAFERASQYSMQNGVTVICPKGDLVVSDSITLYTDASSTGGLFYKAKGSRFKGNPRGTTVVKNVVGTKEINATVYLEGGRGLGFEGIDILDNSADSYGIYGKVDVSFSTFRDLFISTKKWGIFFEKHIYVAVKIEDIVIASDGSRSVQHAVSIPGGTTYTLKNVAAFGVTGDAFFLSGNYCEVGPLACDDCGGIPYTFTQFDGSISTLGVENLSVQSTGTLLYLKESSSVNIDTLGLYGIVQPQGAALIKNDSFGRVEVGSIRADSRTQFNGMLSKVTTNGDVEVGYCNKSFSQKSEGRSNLGTTSGTQYTQNYGQNVFSYVRLPEAPQNDTTARYRILGVLNNIGGCIGTIVEARGDGSYPRSAAYDINVIGSNNQWGVARRVKKAVSDTGSNNYNAWYTASYKGKTYILCKLDTNGTRNLGSYFTGVVNGTDPNLFEVVTETDVTDLSAHSSGVVLSETAS